MYFKRIILSDIHLGTESSKVNEVNDFLKNNYCDELILNGDIIDAWSLKRYGKWKKRHTTFFRRILKLMEDHKTKVIYIRGNHDDFLDEVLPFKMKNFNIVKEKIIKIKDKKYYIIHGDIFDTITTNAKWISVIGSIGYDFLLWVNKLVNKWRTKKGLPYFSLSKMVKEKVKAANSFVFDFEDKLVELANQKGFDGIICGHIHTPANKIINNIHYLNSGDWVENSTAIVQTEKDELKIISYEKKSKDRFQYSM
jgi:UDP-2,3-diacylglucosamine pyrophosphatase LpxH